MTHQGVLIKMNTEIGSPIQYELTLDQEKLLMNDFLDKEIQLDFVGYQCLACSAKKKIYRQGHCYNCFYQLPQTADWIMKPELSKAHLGIEDRDLAFEQEVQLKPHIVYLALSSEVKVGVTRKTQVPTRWIDQGANQALAILEVPNRYLAGIAEVSLKDHLADKTNWRKMLKNDVPEADLAAVRDEVAQYLPEETREFLIKEDALDLDFPVLQYPEKVKSLNLVKTPSYSGVLKGIKGQYLIFEDNTVFNVRSNEGTVVSLSLV